MRRTKLYEHQQRGLELAAGKNRVAFYWDMGLGKTHEGSEKMNELGAKMNLVICQKSKINDWMDHFKAHYPEMSLFNLTRPNELNSLMQWVNVPNAVCVAVINYELAFRRSELLKLKDFTLLLDESSLIQNEQAKRTKFIMKMNPANVILLSGTPTGGKYEKLWSQMQLLGWKISKPMFYNHYVSYHYEDNNGFPLMVIDGYKNEERLKRKMRSYGCQFLKSDEVFDLPEQVEQKISIPITAEYRTFRKDSIVAVDDLELVGDTVLTKMLYERQLCGAYNLDKLEAFRDLVESTTDRLIVFYNFNNELDALMQIANECKRQFGAVNGQQKNQEVLNAEGAILFVQYQAGAMGLNLQIANRIIYFTPPLSSELFEQSKKRTHRIGQKRTCFYYYLTCKGSVEERIYKSLAMRRDFTEALFEEV